MKLLQNSSVVDLEKVKKDLSEKDDLSENEMKLVFCTGLLFTLLDQ